MRVYTKPPLASHKNRLYRILFSDVSTVKKVEDIVNNEITLKGLLKKWRYKFLYKVFELRVIIKRAVLKSGLWY